VAIKFVWSHHPMLRSENKNFPSLHALIGLMQLR
jgi:hypothetical protein